MIINNEEFKWTNADKLFIDIPYASVTAQNITRFDIFLDDTLIDTVYAGGGGSHSWWSAAGGKLLPSDQFPNGIPQGSTLRIVPDSLPNTAIRVDTQP